MNTKRNYNRIFSDLALILCIVFLISYSLFSGSANGNIVKNADNGFIQFLPQVSEAKIELKDQIISGCCFHDVNHNIRVTPYKSEKKYPHSSFSPEKPKLKGISEKEILVKHCITSAEFLYFPESTFKYYPFEYPAGISSKAGHAFKVRPPPSLIN